MKRTISLVIAIAVMISMFIVPASAATQNEKTWTHFVDEVRGATSGNAAPGTGGAYTELEGYAGVEGATFEFQGWVDPNAGVDSFAVSKDGGTTWAATDYEFYDRSAEGVQGYRVRISTTGQAAGSYWDVVYAIVDGVAYDMIGFTYTLAPKGAITSPSQFTPGENKLTQDISGNFSAASGTYIIDLAGHTWSHNNVAMDVNGANVTIIDSVGGGKISVYPNDAINVNSGSLTLNGVTVSADGGGMDALFVNGGTVNVINSTLVATKAGIDVSQNGDSATITVDGATFGVYAGSEDPARSCAIEFRNNNKKVILKGDIKFNNNLILRRDDCSKSLSELISFGENASATFSADGALIQGRWTPNTINYTYTAPVETKLGASIEITNGIALDFVVSNAPANAVVMIDGVEFGASYVDGQDSHYILDGFGPHTMGDEHTAELYVDGELFATKTYSVKEYCLDVINGAAINDAHKALAKEILNYGAKAQVYVDYDAENLVNDGVVSEGTYVAADDVALILNDFAGASANWVNANVKFGDTLELIINLSGDADEVVVTIGTESTTYEVLTTASGAKYIVVTDITPDQFKDSIAAVAYNGDVKVSKTLVYSVGSYINDRVENSTNEAYVELVKALSIYGDAVAAFVA